ncbi:VWA domain-containing protein [Polyangium sp. 15x6]|uniref:vWA domain-containing protein n=1 Tax=Polyangium sp. 15x6 TaxID=3042687 RepID=UPI00249C324C|nr:VWA domain-containing protein [Polyangium sp. 15x6]MDI3291184.1 VWA domain-containing protein [Polyangium sp. 15x6]
MTNRWLRVPRTRRALAASLLALCAGGLILHRAPLGARTNVAFASPSESGAGATFSGRGAHGSITLTQSRVFGGSEARISAVLRIKADQADARERAPLALAIVLDTSGSMMTESKMKQAKDAVVELIRELRDDDQITLVRYASDSEVLQSLARVGDVRERLVARVHELSASGGTNIPPALSQGMWSLANASPGRVKRVVLVSDGLDGGRIDAERIARGATEDRVTVSSLGIGLDFDPGYMGGVAEAGRGNFAFVKDGAALQTFLRRELEETAATTVEATEARFVLPEGVRFVRAIGAEARTEGDGREVTLRIGSLFAGDERRVVVELAANAEAGEKLAIGGEVGWSLVGGERTRVALSPLDLQGTADAREAELSVDRAAFAEATSALASSRQLEAAAALEQGDMQAAQRIVDENIGALRAAAEAAPAPAATAIQAQVEAYERAKQEIHAAPPKSAGAKAAARSMADKEFSNLGRAAAY